MTEQECLALATSAALAGVTSEELGALLVAIVEGRCPGVAASDPNDHERESRAILATIAALKAKGEIE